MEIENIMKSNRKKSARRKRQSQEKVNEDDHDAAENEDNDDEEPYEQEVDQADVDARLRIDPNYRWLLKDLRLSNEKRVIDVTELIAQHEQHETGSHEAEDEDEAAEMISTSRTTADKSVQDQTGALSNGEVENDDEQDSALKDTTHPDYDEHNFISKLYEKLVRAEDNDDEHDNDHVIINILSQTLSYKTKTCFADLDRLPIKKLF